MSNRKPHILPDLLFLIFAVSITACGSITQKINNSEVYSKNHTGFYLYDPSTSKILSEVNGNKYFTPASNTKIFTFYTALNILGDSIPGLKYYESGDSLFLWGTGDPSFLHAEFTDRRVYDFLRERPENIYLSFDNFYDETFGPGWAWDDYPYYFQPEKASFPVYGNVVHVVNKTDTAGLIITPDYFQKFDYPLYESLDPGRVLRDPASNIIYSGQQPDSIAFDRFIPFKYSEDLVVNLLADTLSREIVLINAPANPGAKIYNSVPADSLYKKMMHASDNFIAEQILLMCADKISDSLNTDIAIKYSKTHLLADLADDPIWKDGSGLSRYNLFTPRSIVQLWHKIYQLVPEERLFDILASGGESGTIQEWYQSDQPYIFGKTGTLSNNHTLSGFLRTKKGKLLIFSFMHNNYTVPSSSIKKEMEKTLWEIHEKY